jgi:DNA polymerase-3 subunit alpha
MSFVHLHNHSDHSLLDGAASVKSMVARAKALGMPGLAITDHGNLFGALKFYKECKAAGINPIVGCEFYVAGSSRFEKAGTENGNKYYHLVLLARNAEGWANLRVLASRAYTEGFYYKPRIDDELLRAHASGLICSTACIAGEVPQYVLSGKEDQAERKALEYRELFGKEHFFLELQDHGMDEERRVNRALVAIARKHGIPTIATNDMHYLEREDAKAHDALLCIGTNRKLADRDRMRFPGDEFYMKSPDEMAALFSEVPEAIKNTLLVNEMVSLDMSLPGPLLPEFEIPAEFSSMDGGEVEREVESVAAYLRGLSDEMVSKPHPKYGKAPSSELAPGQRAMVEARLAAPVSRYFIHASYDGMRKRYPDADSATIERLVYELGTIILMDFVGYFLIVADFINWAKDHGIPVGPGRGSGAGSIVAYSLRITDIDPLRYHLLFERFLNLERVSMPDFDVDFCFERRGEVIEYVTKRYGADRVGQIITFGTLKAKAVIKDVARAMDIPFDEANEIAKLVPEDPKMTLEKAFAEEPKLAELASQEKYRELFAIARKLENKNRHASFHAAGIVIGKTSLTDYVPLYRDPKTGQVATQYTMDQLEECGLVKMDFLGLKTLTLIKNTIDLVRARGVEIDEERIPDDDRRTYELLGEGKSTSVFQFESSGMQGILKQAKPNRMEDLIALNALYRPGPMAYIPQFIDCKQGRQKISYPDKRLEPVLKETYGVIVYQEQVMQVAQIIAGYSLGQADLLRRAMGKKKPEVLAKERVPFVAGAERLGYSADDANRIYDILVPFAEYGFNKSHAAAYSVVAYRTAYLKANYPAEFMAANLTNEITNPDKLSEYIAEARSMRIELLPPDVNRSEAYFTVSEGRIVYGLLGIKGVGDALAREIVARRAAGGPFKDPIDFLERLGAGALNKKTLESLALAGCFDSLGKSRGEVIANLERAVAYVQEKERSRAYGQASLFDDSDEKEYPDFEWNEGAPYERSELLRLEKELLGFYFSGHPMDEWKAVWERSADLDLSRPERASPDRLYTVVGLLREFREIVTKAGKRMAFGVIEDFVGRMEIVVFASTLELAREKFVVDQVVCLRGKVDLSRANPSLKVEELPEPAALREKSWREVHIKVESASGADEDLYELRDLLFKHRGQCGVFLHVRKSGKDVVVRAHAQVNCSGTDAMMRELASTRGVAESWRA